MTHIPHQPLAPNPSLLAILLVTKTRSGPRLILHYPPHPSARTTRSQSPTTTRQSLRSHGTYSVEASLESDTEADNRGAWSDSSFTSEGTSDEDALETSAEEDEGDEETRANRDEDDDEDEDDDDDADENERGRDWQGADAVLGRYSADGLAKLLAPNSRMWHRRRWEVALEERCFLGCPIFAREEGGWRRKGKREKRRRGDKKGKSLKGAVREEEGKGEETVAEEDFDPDDDEGNGEEEEEGVAGPLATNVDTWAQPSTSFTSASSGSRDDAEDETDAADNDLQMFNVVFVLRPAPLEYAARVVEMYEHVVRKLAKALRWQQRENSYVAKEVRKIAGTVDGFREETVGSSTVYYSTHLWSRLQASSSLARALAAAYDAIATSRIAHVSLGSDGLQLSLQIPRPMSTSYVNTPTNPQIPGLCLTSSVTMTSLGGVPDGPEEDNDDNDVEVQAGIVSPFAAILLLVPPETLLKELTMTANSPQASAYPTTSSSPTDSTAPRSLAGPLAYFIRNVVPTKTLLQLSRSTCRGLSLADLQLLATHLVSWRRAHPLAPPLNASHTYSPSPNADFRRLRSAEGSFARAFPMLPGLVAILSKLGRGPPTPYMTLVPSSDHKVVYVNALAWLVRGGWVVQLRTFAWVRVGGPVKRRVREEDRRAAAAAIIVDEDDAATIASMEFGTPARRVSSTSEAGQNAAALLLSPRASAQFTRRTLFSDGGSTTSSARTAIPISTLSLTDGDLIGTTAGDGTAPRRESAGASTNGKTPVPLQTLSHRRSASLGGTSSTGTTKLRPKPSTDLRSIFSAAASTGPQLSATSSPFHGLNDQGDEEEEDPAAFEPSVILSPHKANALESRWLASIAASLRDKDARNAWPRLVKYFDGRHALEEITAREGLKRKVLAPILARLMSEEEGCLITVKHW